MIINSKLINYSTDMYGSCQGIIVSKKLVKFSKKKKEKNSWIYIRKTRLSKNSPIYFSLKTTKFAPKKFTSVNHVGVGIGNCAQTPLVCLGGGWGVVLKIHNYDSHEMAELILI
jgi:hypothetical protein